MLLTFLLIHLHAVLVKDLCQVRGIRENQLIGYGLVVGLKATGDSKIDVTLKALGRMYERLGLKLGPQDNIASRNVAAVIVTANLPPFAKAGHRLDVTVSAVGDATSLEGGILIQTPLKAANDMVYAVAQGPVSVSQYGKDQIPTVGRVVQGALIEKDVEADFSTRRLFRLTLKQADVFVATKMARKINETFGGYYAMAVDPATVDLTVPVAYESQPMEFLSMVEQVDVPTLPKAKVVINERSQTILITEGVKVSPFAVSHGSLFVKMGNQDQTKDKNQVVLFEGRTLKELVETLSRLGTSVKDLSAILQAIHRSGALHAELELIP